MIRHCVFIRFRADVSKAQKAAIFGEIAALKQRVPGLLAVHPGNNVSPETGMDKGYREGFIVDFAGPEARDTYLADPDHAAAGARIVAAAEGGIEGILVYDIEIA